MSKESFVEDAIQIYSLISKNKILISMDKIKQAVQQIENHLPMYNAMHSSLGKPSYKVSYGNELIDIAIEEGLKELCKLIIKPALYELNNKIHVFEYTYMHMAAMYGHQDICELLIDASPDMVSVPAKKGEFPYNLAYDLGYKELYKFLVSQTDIKALCAPRNENGVSILNDICFRGELKSYFLMPKLTPEEINAQDFNGNTALHSLLKGIFPSKCIYLNTKHIMALHLIKAGADLNLPDNEGQTPLYLAEEGKIQQARIPAVTKLIRGWNELFNETFPKFVTLNGLLSSEIAEEFELFLTEKCIKEIQQKLIDTIFWDNEDLEGYYDTEEALSGYLIEYA